LREAGLINAQGADALYQRIVFPLHQDPHVVNLYGRSIVTAFAHRFLPGGKGGLYRWEQVQRCSDVILVEGLFDYTALRQAGFSKVTCSLGTHLNAHQFGQLCDGSRMVYIAFDDDANQSGRHAAQQLAHRLAANGISARRVLLPERHDPNSFFVGGEMRISSSLFWRPQSYEIPRNPRKDSIRRTQPHLRDRTRHGERRGLDQPLPGP
jgi:DNA primase